MTTALLSKRTRTLCEWHLMSMPGEDSMHCKAVAYCSTEKAINPNPGPQTPSHLKPLSPPLTWQSIAVTLVIIYVII